MRIAQVCPYDFDRPGGVQAHIRDTALALQELGHEVTVIAPRVRRTEPAPPSEVRVVKLGQARVVGFAGTAFELSLVMGQELRALRSLMHTGRFDVVNFHSIWTPVMPMQAFLASDAASVTTVHETPPEGLPGALPRVGLGLASRLTFPHVDALIAVSRAARSNVHAAEGQPEFILPPCTDLRRFLQAPESPPRKDGQPITILFAGRLEPRKGAMVLLQAYRRLCAEGLAVRLQIAGAGQEEAALRQRVIDESIPDVAFTGHFQDAEAPALFGGCDIFCAPSIYGESFGIVLAEAMTAGRPVVAAANRGYRTVLTGQGARFLTHPRDVDALYRALRTLVLDESLRVELGAWGRREALQYDCRQVAPRLIEVYAAAIARHRARPKVSAVRADLLSAHPGEG